MLKRHTCNWAILLGSAAGAVVVSLGILQRTETETFGVGWFVPDSKKVARDGNAAGFRTPIERSGAGMKNGRVGESLDPSPSWEVPSFELGIESGSGVGQIGVQGKSRRDSAKSTAARAASVGAGKREGGTVRVVSNAPSKSGGSEVAEVPTAPPTKLPRTKPTADELYRAKFGSQAYSQLLLERRRQESAAAGLLPSGSSAVADVGISEADQHPVNETNPVATSSQAGAPVVAYTESPATRPVTQDERIMLPVGTAGSSGSSPAEPLWIHPAWVPLPTTSTPPEIRVRWIGGRLSFDVVGRPLVGLQIQRSTAVNPSNWQTVYQFTEEKGVSWSETPGASGGFWRLKR